MLPQPTVIDEDGEESKLDDVLGTGFALLSLGPEAAKAFVGLDQPIWDALAAKRVALVSRSDGAGRQGDVRVVVDLDISLAGSLDCYRNKILLVRPDRYVAAAFELQNSHDIASRLSSFVAGSE